jgi:hypothetical protein
MPGRQRRRRPRARTPVRITRTATEGEKRTKGQTLKGLTLFCGLENATASSNIVGVAVKAEKLLQQAAVAQRASKRVAFAKGFDPSREGDWIELVKDVVALANSGGGVVVVDRAGVVREEIRARLETYAAPQFAEFDLHSIERGGETVTAVVVDDVAGVPLVFTQEGRYVDHLDAERLAFTRGGLFFRHGSRSEAATGDDVRAFIQRQLDATRHQWLSNIRAVMHAPGGAEIAVVETAERDEEGRPTLIRLTTDPAAPLYGQIDPDLSHPFRQKEVVSEINARLDGRNVNAFDVLSVRRIHEISEETHPEFVHVPKFGSPQYSEAFVDWLVEQDARDSQFFARAKARYVALRRRRH